MGWEVYPEGLFRLLTRLHDEYDLPPLFITENGAAFADARRHDGSVHDPERIAYLEGHIEALGRAIDAGVPVAGYFVWSLLDNFEWAPRVLAALRSDLRRLPDARARAEAELSLVPRLHRRAALRSQRRPARRASPSQQRNPLPRIPLRVQTLQASASRPARPRISHQASDTGRPPPWWPERGRVLRPLSGDSPQEPLMQ